MEIYRVRCFSDRRVVAKPSDFAVYEGFCFPSGPPLPPGIRLYSVPLQYDALLDTSTFLRNQIVSFEDKLTAAKAELQEAQNRIFNRKTMEPAGQPAPSSYG